MKPLLLSLFALIFITQCNFKKATTISIQNKNNYNITIEVIANNISSNPIKVNANTKQESIMDWTNLEKKDGAYQLLVTHNNTETDTFSHGYYTSGELTNYIDIVVENHEVKISVSE
jgi:hypothetical protein